MQPIPPTYHWKGATRVRVVLNPRALGFGYPRLLTNLRVSAYSPLPLQCAMSVPFRTLSLIIYTHMIVFLCMGGQDFVANAFGHRVLAAPRAVQHTNGTRLAPVHCNNTGVITFGVCFWYAWTPC